MTIAGQTFTVTQDGQSATKKTLTILKQGTGNGSVAALTGKITWNGNQGVAEYDLNTSVTLMAEGDMTSDFVKWDKCDTVSSNQCTVKMSASKTVAVTFNLKTKGFMLTVTKTGTGDGTVTPSTGVLNFNGNMAMTEYPDGTQVMLKGNPATGSTFVAWTGCDQAIGSQCTVNMTAEKIVAIEFKADNKKPVKDFDGDGKSDVLLRNAKTGDVVIWLMNGAGISRGDYVVMGIPADWQIKAIGDFNGDGKTDILWQNTDNGDVAMWLMDGAKISSGDYVVKGVPKDWEFRDIGDFNSDGKADVLWQDATTGDVAVWFMDGTKISSGDLVVKGMPSDWTLKAVADLNNDGKADVIWQAANGDVYVWLMDGARISDGSDYAARGIPGSWQVKGVRE
ncbi:FG-GAP repeat-containing protein, partial [Candidatus Magnetobacterium bavaricum]